MQSDWKKDMVGETTYNIGGSYYEACNCDAIRLERFETKHGAHSSFDGIEVAQMVGKKQFQTQGSGFEQFAALAG